MAFRIALIALLLSISYYSENSLAQFPEEISLNDILHKADSVSSLQDSLLEKMKYKFKASEYFNEVDDKGNIKNSDTTIAVIIMQGKKELSRETIYSTRKPEGKKEESKAEIGFTLSPNNPDYNFSLTGKNDSSYIIAIEPKASPPKKGDVRGTMVVDRQHFTTVQISIEVPKSEGALKEFASVMIFEPLEGGLVVMKEMNMRGYAKALLGLFKIRFTGNVRYSDYQILEQVQ